MNRSEAPSLHLSIETLTLVQKLISEAKSLGQIARVITSFFHEYEILQKKQNFGQPVQFPVIIPVSEFHQIIVPRKRRIYDVLHVLEGLGVVTRARIEDENITRRKGGYFLYYGRNAAYRALLAMREDTSRLWNANGSVHSQEKRAIDHFYTMEQLPCLAVTAANFICLLLRDQGTKAISLHDISVRLLCAKTIKVRKEEDRNQVDVNRRIYDVVSVLATFNVVRISLDPSQKHTKGNRFGDKYLLRKHVMFNYALFNDQRQIKIADYSAKQLRNYLNEEKHDTLPEQLFKHTYSHYRSFKWHNDFDRPALPCWESDSTKQRHTAYGRNKSDAKRTLPGALAYPKNQIHTILTSSPWLRKRHRRMKNTVSSSDLCPLASISPEMEEEAWWSESLKPLLFFEDNPTEGKLPRNTSNMSTHKKEIWGFNAVINGISQRKKQASRRLFDLYCHEVLDEPSGKKTTQDWLKWLR